MNLETVRQIVDGAIILASWAIALYFLRYWCHTRDQLFGCFALAFLLFGLERIVLILITESSQRPAAYLIRLAAFLLIVFGFINKNRASS